MTAETLHGCAKERLSGLMPGDAASALVDQLSAARTGNLEWYLDEKIVRTRDREGLKDHVRVLKYSLLFALRGAKVTILREGQQPAPDIEVQAGQHLFFAEVKKFRLAPGATHVNPRSKIVGAVKGKIKQLLKGQINFVAIDNFDLNIESDALDGGFSHQPIHGAFETLEAACTQEPAVYGKLSGAIFAANSSGGLVSGRGQLYEAAWIPHYVWLNPAAAQPVPKGLGTWVVGALPDGLALTTGQAGEEPP